MGQKNCISAGGRSLWSGTEVEGWDWMSDMSCQREEVGMRFLNVSTLLTLSPPFCIRTYARLLEKARRSENTLAVGEHGCPVSTNVNAC